MTVVIINQSATVTAVKCPRCRRAIDLYHERQGTGANDSFGPLYLKEQNFQKVVCMNKSNDKYCEFAGNMNIEKMRWKPD